MLITIKPNLEIVKDSWRALFNKVSLISSLAHRVVDET